MTNTKQDRTYRQKKNSDLNNIYNRKEIVPVSNLKAILTLPPYFSQEIEINQNNAASLVANLLKAKTSIIKDSTRSGAGKGQGEENSDERKQKASKNTEKSIPERTFIHTLCFLPHNFQASVEAFGKHVTRSSRYSQILACHDVITENRTEQNGGRN